MTPFPVIPDHTLRRSIGRGAYGEVWLARNVMGAPRAVKIVWRRDFESDRPYEREFAGIQRYEPVSRSADGLVHVLHVGRNDADGYFYYVMELADSAVPLSDGELEGSPAQALSATGGVPVELSPLVAYVPRTLRSDMQRIGRLPTADCLRVALDLVGGLARLHDRGLVHRDVKPGNIIFIDGRAKLADIGLVSTESEGRTFVGTEGYIPPEGPGAPTADLYALGMVLYEASTGYGPDQFPKVPSAWFAEEAGPEPLEFHEVVLRACESDRARRYRSAEEMQADLALLQSGQSVRRWRALERRVRRWRGIGWAAALGGVVAVGTALAAHWRARVAAENQAKETRLLEQARTSLSRAEVAEQESRRQLNAALFEQARALVLSKELGHRNRALEALRRARVATNLAELRGVAFAALALPDLRLDREFRLDPETTMAQPNHAFTRVAVGRGQEPVTVCSFSTLEVLATLPASTNLEVYQSVWSGDDRFLAVKRQHDDGGVRSDWEVWDVGRTRRVITVGPDVAHRSVTFHPSQPRFLAGHGRGPVTEWDLESGRERRTFRFPDTPHVLVYSPDGGRLAVCYRDGPAWVVAIHDATSLEVVRTFPWPESVETLSWHPQGRWIVANNGRLATEWSRGVRLMDLETGEVRLLGEHRIKTTMAEFAGDGQYLISGGWDREIICWDLQTMQRAFTYAGTGYQHYWKDDGRWCLVELPDGVRQVYEFVPPGDRALPGNPGEDLHAGRFSPDGRWLATRDNRQLCLWDLQSDSAAVCVPVSRNAVPSFSPDSRELFAVPEEYSRRNSLERWQLTPGAKAGSPQIQFRPVNLPKGFTWAAPTGDDLILAGSEGVRILPLTNVTANSGRVVHVPPGLGSISPDGRWLAMLHDYSPLVRVYRLPGVEEVAQLQTSNFVSFITFSPRSDELLVLNRSGAEWFDTATWQRTRRRAGAPVSGSYAIYTPDGTGIWMVTHFRRAALLDQRTLEPLLPLPNDVLPLAISPDGRRLAVSVGGRQVRLWDVGALRRELTALGLDW